MNVFSPNDPNIRDPLKFHETCVNILSCDDHAVFYSSQRSWVNRIKKLKESHPDEVIIHHENEDGSIVAYIPQDWVSIRPKRKVAYSDEVVAMRAQRMRDLRRKRKEAQTT